jgi:saccharopine dehydrogenase (NAD+, L-lysine-forming)
MNHRILILGGYGGAGRPLAKNLLKYHPCELTIAGRNLAKAQAFQKELLRDFPHSSILPIALDAADRTSLLSAFKGMDLVIVTATIPYLMQTVAEAALEAGTDLMDILVRGDVVDKLSDLQSAIREKGRRFITQCGFHPGMIAPFIRLTKDQFDDYQEARVFMAMDPIFETPESVHELMYEVSQANPQILEGGQWKKAGYKDMKKVDFPKYFGPKACYPLPMREIYSLDQELGLSAAGTYAAGFGPYIDYVIFTLAYVLGKINVRWSQKVCSQLFYNHIKKLDRKLPRVEMILQARGMKNGEKKALECLLSSEDGYELTAQAVVACLNQYFDGSISGPGLYLMGEAVDEVRLFEDLGKMGISTKFVNKSFPAKTGMIERHCKFGDINVY